MTNPNLTADEKKKKKFDLEEEAKKYKGLIKQYQTAHAEANVALCRSQQILE